MIPARLLLVGVALLLMNGCGTPRPLTVATIDELSLHLSSFHRHPSQEEFRLILNSFARFDGDQQMRQDASLMATFVIFATERYGFTIDGVPDSLPLTRFRAADHVTFTSWLANGSTSPQKNDVWWMAYFCTGEERWLDQLLEVASIDATTTDGKGAVLDLAGSSARWSYKVNAAQWEEIQRHAERHAVLGNAFAVECVSFAKEHPERRQ